MIENDEMTVVGCERSVAVDKVMRYTVRSFVELWNSAPTRKEEYVEVSSRKKSVTHNH